MLSNGLLDELIDFRNEMRLRAKVIYAEADRHESKSHSGDGVFNIIGLKEFGQFFIDLESCIASTTEKENMPPVMKVVASNILTSLRSESECGISEIELRTGAALEFNHTVHLSDLEQKNLVNQLKSAIEKVILAITAFASISSRLNFLCKIDEDGYKALCETSKDLDRPTHHSELPEVHMRFNFKADV